MATNPPANNFEQMKTFFNQAQPVTTPSVTPDVVNHTTPQEPHPIFIPSDWTTGQTVPNPQTPSPVPGQAQVLPGNTQPLNAYQTPQTQQMSPTTMLSPEQQALLGLIQPQNQQPVPQQGTPQQLDYNALFTQMMGGGQQQAPNDPVVDYLKANTEALQQLLNTQQQAQQVDYSQYDSNHLLELINGSEDEGKGSKIKDVLDSVKQKAVKEAASQYETKYTQLEGVVKAMHKQHTEMQAQVAIAQHRMKYEGQDPEFTQNMVEASKILAANGNMLQDNPSQALETAYKIVLSQRMLDPKYLQTLSARTQQNPQQTVQSPVPVHPGMYPVQPVAQNTVPFGQPQAQPVPKLLADAQLTADILNFGSGHPSTMAFTV